MASAFNQSHLASPWLFVFLKLGRNQELTLGPPPCIFRARTVATRTTTLGTRPEARHLMLKNFSIPISAPKPASVTVRKQVGNELLVSEHSSRCWQSMSNNSTSIHKPCSCHTRRCVSCLYNCNLASPYNGRCLTSSHKAGLSPVRPNRPQGLTVRPRVVFLVLTPTKAFLNIDEIFNFGTRLQTLSKGQTYVILSYFC